MLIFSVFPGFFIKWILTSKSLLFSAAGLHFSILDPLCCEVILSRSNYRLLKWSPWTNLKNDLKWKQSILRSYAALNAKRGCNILHGRERHRNWKDYGNARNADECMDPTTASFNLSAGMRCSGSAGERNCSGLFTPGFTPPSPI